MPKTDPGFRIEVFRPGTFTPMVGEPISYSADDLAGIVDAYDPDEAPAPVVIGHPTTDAPAYAWVSGFEYDADAERLYADIDQVDEAFADAVKAGRYKKVSMSFHTPDAPNNPVPGKWYAKHVGFLGGAAPAVSGLKPVAFAAAADGEEVTFEAAFGEAGFEDTANLFRGLRDFFIEKFGLETADNVLPSYRIEWLGDREISPPGAATPLFTAPTEEEPTMTPEEIQAEKDRLDARAAELDARDQALADGEAERRNATHTAFAEKLIADGKLLPVMKDKVIGILDAMPADQAVSFAEGSEEPVVAALMELLEGQPAAVAFGETPLGEDPGDIAEDAQAIASFATAYQKEQADLGIHVSTSDAVVHVMKGAAK